MTTPWRDRRGPVERRYPPAKVLLANGEPAWTRREEGEGAPRRIANRGEG